MLQKITILLVLSLFLFSLGCSAQEAPIVEDLLVNPNPVEEEAEDLFIDDEPETPFVGEVQDLPSVREILMIAQKYEFIPETVTVQEGERVRLVIESTDVDHGISIPAFGINENLEAGKTTTFEFVADTKGEFPMICSIFCGTGHGSMRGTLVVE